MGRAIESALGQQWPKLEVIVVDDASTDETPDVIPRDYPSVRFLRHERNKGVGRARETGIDASSHPWILLLDDDDEFLPGAFTTITESIQALPHYDQYPVLQFPRDNGFTPGPYTLIRLHHYLEGTLGGDFVPLINKSMFRAHKLSFPATRVGGEHLLWWELADTVGIPTWSAVVAKMNADAPLRLTSPEHQTARAAEYAQLQRDTLRRFGPVLKARYPDLYREKVLGGAIYSILAGDRAEARSFLRQLETPGADFVAFGLRCLMWLPRPVAKQAFLLYRRITGSGQVPR